MKIESFLHQNVKFDGTFEDKAGAVETEGGIRMSNGEGCDLSGCKCSEGHWITIVEPRNSYGEVKGVRVQFDDGAEMKRFFQNRSL